MSYLDAFPEGTTGRQIMFVVEDSIAYLRQVLYLLNPLLTSEEDRKTAEEVDKVVTQIQRGLPLLRSVANVNRSSVLETLEIVQSRLWPVVYALRAKVLDNDEGIHDVNESAQTLRRAQELLPFLLPQRPFVNPFAPQWRSDDTLYDIYSPEVDFLP